VRTIIRLPRQYDVARLRADLAAAQRVGDEHENRGDYHDGGWSAIALYSVGGETTPEALRWAGWGAAYQPTPVLAHCPYFAEIIDGFASPKARVRLLQLAPGTEIHEHQDDGDGWAIGKVRLHIPIITSDEVYFYVDGERVRMQPGELWYCDFTRPHRVHNRSDVGRIHLVLDLMVDDWLRLLFPPEPLGERIRNAAQHARYRAGAARYALSGRLRDLGRLSR
jgi:quercetin dioxygenase-like cupin family protein